MALLVATLLLLGSTTALRAGEPPTTSDPALAAAGWLAEQVETDATLGVGSLADAIFAFAAVGAGQSAAATALAGIEAGLEAYAFPGGAAAPGAVAKVMLAVQVQGADPNAFGGRDLEAALRATLVVGGADDGRFGAGSILDQSLAILALSRTSGGVPVTALAWLVGAQCPSGEYAWDGSCPAAPGAEDPDTTGFALQALLAGGETTAADAAVAWLLSVQQTGGGLPSFGLANTNSSGVGGQALRAAGETAAAEAAAAFVVSLAVGCDGAASDVGAIEWAPGIPGFLVFSTPQAVLALGGPPLDELSAAGAVPEAPVLDCADPAPAETPTPVPSAEPAPQPPAGGELPNTSVEPDPGMEATRLALAALGLAALVAARRRRAA
jgi:MYXO-CTERM domain-containing protein